MKLTLLGAQDTVTGSRTMIRFHGCSYMVDCGLFQGPRPIRDRNWAPFPPCNEVKGVVLTHAHLDHSGFLPRLYKQGYRGPVFASEGTCALSRLILMDAAHLEEEQAHFANASGYSNHKPAEPLFTREDAEGVLKQFIPIKRQEWILLEQGLSFKLIRAGHIPGASMVQFSVPTSNGLQLVTFSGDVGSYRSMTMRPPDPLLETDILVLESTYGNRCHGEENVKDAFEKIALRTFARNGVLVIPAFAVGRCQEILYLIRTLENEGRLPAVPVIVDSPMSLDATDVYLRCEDDHALGAAFSQGGKALTPRLFEASRSVDESMLTCMREGPMVVISASGMVSGGRILHHLKKRLPQEENTVLFVGYQAEGTKGSILQSKKFQTLRIHHEEIPIECEIATLDQLSAHADLNDLLTWVGLIQKKPSLIIVNHGSVEAQKNLAQKIRESFQIQVVPACEQVEFSLCKD
jgi:metallo-beta-lactamase family protein